MRLTKIQEPLPSMDGVADPQDIVQVRILKGRTVAHDAAHTLYVDVNGITVLRIGLIRSEVEVTRV